VWSFSGVRPLIDDGAKKPEDVTRDYELVLDKPFGKAPLLTIYGGKITTHRRLAEAAMEKIGPYFAARPEWTAHSHLPGGDFPADGFYDQLAETIGRWPFLSEPHARRLTRAYGTRVERILGNAHSMQDLGPRSHQRRASLSNDRRMGGVRRGRALASQQVGPEGDS
jgi:glycerol-3-phosphate dehydrogenase